MAMYGDMDSGNVTNNILLIYHQFFILKKHIYKKYIYKNIEAFIRATRRKIPS